MSSAQRTPRYVDVIRPDQAAARVLPLRAPEDLPPVPASQPPRHWWGRASVVPVHRRPWRVLIVSARPGALTRNLSVTRWQLRGALIALALLATLATAFVAAVVIAVQTPDLLTDGTDVPALRAELGATQDSLVALRASLLVAAAAATTTPAPVAGEAITVRRGVTELPVIGALASRFSLARRHPLLHVLRPHLGIDVAAPRGTRVSAPAAGRVQFVGRKLGFGLVVELDHGRGVVTRYAHLRSSAVHVGEQVTKGEAIAAVGMSGMTTGPHLHYEVLVRGQQVDPLRFHFAGDPAPAPVDAPPVR